MVLLRGPDRVCSGILLSPRVVLTAATCLGTDGLALRVHFGSAPEPGDLGWSVIHTRVAPGFRGGAFENNVALLLLSSEAPVEPLGTPFLGKVLADQAAGRPARVVGFGGPQATPLSTLTRRSGVVRLYAIDASTYFHNPDPASICVGDEGGPFFLTLGRVEYLAGVIGRLPDQMCVEQGSVAQRLDSYLDDFIAPLVRIASPGGAMAGERCFFSAACGEGQCVPALEAPMVTYCATSCATSAQCPAGMTCLTGPEGDRCRFPRAMPEVLGAICQGDEDCETRRCRRAIGGGTKVCTVSCEPSMIPACPAGSECRPELGGPGGHACFGEGVDAPTASGCSTGRSESPPGWPLGLGLFLLVLWIQRRAPP